MNFNLMANKGSAEDAYALLEGRNAMVEKSGADWSATFRFDNDDQVEFRYRAAYCAEPNWTEQKQGLVGFIAKHVSDPDHLEKMSALALELVYSISIHATPEITDWDDQRVQALHVIADHLDAVVLTNQGVLDTHFRPLAAPLANGEGFTVEAVLPQLATSPTPVVQADQPDGFPHPDGGRAARRMYVLMAMAGRSMAGGDEGNGAIAAFTNRDVQGWFGQLDVDGEAAEDELALIGAEPATLQSDQIRDGWLHFESAAVLAWALGIAPKPGYDSYANGQELANWVGFLDPAGSRERLQQARLASLASMTEYRDQLRTVQWRLAEYERTSSMLNLRRIAGAPSDISLAGLKLKKRDLALRGQSIDKVPDDDRRGLAIATDERLGAVSWLLGEVPTHVGALALGASGQTVA